MGNKYITTICKTVEVEVEVEVDINSDDIIGIETPVGFDGSSHMVDAVKELDERFESRDFKIEMLKYFWNEVVLFGFDPRVILGLS